MSEYSKYTLEELIELKKKINQYINDYTDGYFYACNTLKYGHRSHHIYNNFEMARKVFLSYNGDNGFCDLYTNNPKILEQLDFKYNFRIHMLFFLTIRNFIQNISNNI